MLFPLINAFLVILIGINGDDSFIPSVIFITVTALLLVFYMLTPAWKIVGSRGLAIGIAGLFTAVVAPLLLTALS